MMNLVLELSIFTYGLDLVSEGWLIQLAQLTWEYHLIFTPFPPKKPPDML